MVIGAQPWKLCTEPLGQRPDPVSVQVVGVLSVGGLVDLEVHLAQLGLGSPEVGVADQVQVALVIPELDFVDVASKAGAVNQMVGPVFDSVLLDQLLGLGIAGRIGQCLQEVGRRSVELDLQGLAVRDSDGVADERLELAVMVAPSEPHFSVENA